MMSEDVLLKQLEDDYKRLNTGFTSHEEINELYIQTSYDFIEMPEYN